MNDFLKFETRNQNIIQKLFSRSDLKPFKGKKSYLSFRINEKTVLEFRQSFVNGRLAGFHHVYISISPHYHYNNYRHNGNDFSPEDCIKTLKEIFEFLEIDNLQELKPINLEFGLNIIPETDTKTLIDGAIYYRKRPLILNRGEYSKITSGTFYKAVKLYAKGIQCHEQLNAPEIDINTFRFEVKSKKHANIKNYGIQTAEYLLKLETYQTFADELLKDWNYILLLNKNHETKNLTKSEKELLKKYSDSKFWDETISEYFRNKFVREKKKYFQLLQKNFNPNNHIFELLKAKIFSFGLGANFPLNKTDQNRTQTTTNKRKNTTSKTTFEKTPTLLKCKFAPHRLCLVTGNAKKKKVNFSTLLD